jgi:hypothetical protein
VAASAAALRKGSHLKRITLIASALCFALGAVGTFAADRMEKSDKMARSDKMDKMDKSDKDRMGKKDRMVRHDKMDKTDKMEKPGATQ